MSREILNHKLYSIWILPAATAASLILLCSFSRAYINAPLAFTGNFISICRPSSNSKKLYVGCINLNNT